jgi:hypothetical protein
VIGIACLLPSLGYKCKTYFDSVIGIAYLLPLLGCKYEIYFDSIIDFAYLLPFFGHKYEICFDSMIGIAYLLPFLSYKCEICFDSVISIACLLPSFGCKCEICFDSVIGISHVFLYVFDTLVEMHNMIFGWAVAYCIQVPQYVLGVSGYQSHSNSKIFGIGSYQLHFKCTRRHNYINIDVEVD